MMIPTPTSSSHKRTLVSSPIKPVGNPSLRFRGNTEGCEGSTSTGITAFLREIWDAIQQFFTSLWAAISGSEKKAKEEHSTGTSLAGSVASKQKDSRSSQFAETLPKLSHGERSGDTHRVSSQSKSRVRLEKEPEEGEQSRKEAIFEDKLNDATDLFVDFAEESSGTESARITNSIRYGRKVFQAVQARLTEAQPSLRQAVLQDVGHIINEIYTISLETAQKETFSDLMPATQDRMINLIQFALKHPEPLISQTGIEMAESLGISSETIERLRHE